MSRPFVSAVSLHDLFPLEMMRRKRALISFALEVTARCNNNCRHCFINVPVQDCVARGEELSAEEIGQVAGEAVSLGTLWCLITGGEPLVREDFLDIYVGLKEKGLLLTLFTNGTLVTKEHVRVFKKYPPRDIEVSVYGVTQETYERVTRRRGSFAAFRQGLDLLLESGLKVRLKAMALRSNLHEQAEIARFCTERTGDYFRFDPFLHLRHDSDPKRNAEIRSERLLPQEIVRLERSDKKRTGALERECDKLIIFGLPQNKRNYLLRCGAGVNGFHVNPAGVFRLCGALCHPESVYDLRKGSLSNAWHDFVPRVRHMSSERRELLETCQECPLINLCMWCPGHAHLETGQLDALVPYFCEVAHARAKALGREETFVSPRQANMPRTSSEPTLRVRALQPRHYDDNSSL